MRKVGGREGEGKGEETEISHSHYSFLHFLQPLFNLNPPYQPLIRSQKLPKDHPKPIKRRNYKLH